MLLLYIKRYKNNIKNFSGVKWKKNVIKIDVHFSYFTSSVAKAFASNKKFFFLNFNFIAPKHSIRKVTKSSIRMSQIVSLVNWK